MPKRTAKVRPMSRNGRASGSRGADVAVFGWLNTTEFPQERQVGDSVFRLLGVEQAVCFAGEEYQPALGDCVNGLEFTLYSHFVMRKALGDTQELCSEHDGGRKARYCEVPEPQ